MHALLHAGPDGVHAANSCRRTAGPVPTLVRALVTAAVITLTLAACGSGTTTGSGTPSGVPTSLTPTGSSVPTGSSAPTGSSVDNGIAALSPEQIVGKAKAALAAAKTVRVKGVGEDPDGRVAIDMRYGPDGAFGTFGPEGLPVNLVRRGDAVYLKAGRGFWTGYADPAVAKLLAGKNLKATRGDERFTALTDFTDLEKSAYDFLDLSGPLSKRGATTVDGIPAVEVVDTSDEGGTLYVATTGQPYPLSVGSSSDKLTFTDYGKPVTIPLAPTTQIVDAATLPDE